MSSTRCWTRLIRGTRRRIRTRSRSRPRERAETLALLFDLLRTPEELSFRGLTTNIENTYSLVELAERFEIE